MLPFGDFDATLAYSSGGDPCDPWKRYNDGVSQPMRFGGLNGRYDLSSSTHRRATRNLPVTRRGAQ